MTTNDLMKIFENNAVPTRYYSFDGAGGGDCYAVEHLQMGWTLSYYDQRGSQRDAHSYETEDEACHEMFERVRDMVLGEQGRTITLTMK